jgi:hypothetical protein
MIDKIDTQGMSLPGRSKKPSSYDPMPVKHRTIFTEEERMELKQIINEALDEREDRKLFYSDPNPKPSKDIEEKERIEDFYKELLE